MRTVASIRTISHRSVFTPALLESEHNGAIVACDFYVDGSEHGREVPGGYEIGSILNVDHHAPSERMARQISSTNLAIDHVRRFGPAKPDTLVVISHTDCDSVLSSCIMAGELEPETKFGEAAIAADHTGAPNGIADVLQSLDEQRDLYFSLRNLRKLLDLQPLDRIAQPYYAKRIRKRAAAEAVIANRSVAMDGSLAFGVLRERIDGEFFPSKLPDAALILIMTPRTEANRWDAKMRLGQRAPIGASLHDLKPAQFDPHFGGRWNAGSNTRNGGTALDPQNYANRVAERMRQAWGV